MSVAITCSRNDACSSGAREEWGRGTFEGRQLDDDAVEKAREILVRSWDCSSSSSYETWCSSLELVCAATAVQPA